MTTPPPPPSGSGADDEARRAEALRKELLEAFKHLMTPLVRMLLANGVAYGEFAEVVKSVYVEVAGSRDFALPDRKNSASRVAILTGLTRKEVKRLLDAAAGKGIDSTPSVSLNRATRVLQGWYQDPEFVGPYGIPLELPLEGDDPTFATLVRRYSGDMPARAILEELKRVGSVEELPDGLLRAASRQYITSELDPDSARYFGGAIHDLASTIAHNLDPERSDPTLFERAMLREELASALLPQFRAFLEREGMLFLERLEDWVDREENELGESQGDDEPNETSRVGVGVYLFQDDKRDED
jgi:hypothetical protein